MLLLFCRRTISANDLRANEGRETKALNCKPITNLKEKYELSNFSKTSGFILHAVSTSFISTKFNSPFVMLVFKSTTLYTFNSPNYFKHLITKINSATPLSE
jgi:hypothetical protein